MTPPLRVVFLGSDPIALPLLNWLRGEGAARAGVVGVFTQPDRAVGRGQQISPNAIKTWARDHGIPVFQPEKLTDETVAQLRALSADVSLVMAYGRILRETFIAVPRLGTLNFHASILPKLRGASPIQSAIASGEKETGVSLMRIVRRLDAGPVADVERVPIVGVDTAQDVEEKLSAACVPLLQRAWSKLAEGKLVFIEQTESAATYCRRLTKADGALDFTKSAQEVAARINALYPWPGCTIEVNGQVIKLGLAEAEAFETSSKPGELLGFAGGCVHVGAGNGVVKLLRLQRPGGKMLPADEFARGFNLPIGAVISSREMPLLVDREPFPYKK